MAVNTAYPKVMLKQSCACNYYTTSPIYRKLPHYENGRYHHRAATAYRGSV